MTYLRSKERRAGQGFLPEMWVSVTLMFLVLIVSLQLAPSVIDQGRDSGIFAYTGKVIVQGGLPYQDAWDNKLPGVYYLDALAFILFGTNRWALWLIEMISVFLTGRVVFWLLNETYQKRMLAWAGTLMLIFMARSPALVSDVNFTEVYALLPQVLGFAAGYQFYRRPTWRWAFLVGLAAGVAFLFKQTTMGGALAFVPATVLARHPVIRAPRRWIWLGATIAGGLSSLGVVAAYLHGNGILGKAIDATFIAPLAFHRWVSQEPVSIWDTVRQTLTDSVVPMVVGPLLPFLLVGLFVALRPVFVRRYRVEPFANQRALAVWAALTFVLDLVLSNTTYRAYEHYYITLLPSLMLLVVLSLDVIQPWIDRLKQAKRLRVWTWFYLALAVVALPLTGTLFRLWLVGWDIFAPAKPNDLTTYVIEHTQPEDKVLVWGVATGINFRSERLSPLAYSYGYPMIVPEYTTPEEIAEIVATLEANLPFWIVDTTMTDGDRVPPLTLERRERWWADGGRRDVVDLSPVYDFVGTHCTFIEEAYEAAIFYCG